MTEQELADRIRTIRDRLELTQAEVAEKLAISRSALAQIELGERKISAMELIGLAEAFGMSIPEILEPAREAEVRLKYRKGITRPRVQEPAIRISVPGENLEKFREVLLYILGEVGAKPHIGETAIYRLLYFIDFDYYEKYEEQLIGAAYIRNQSGPIPVEFRTIVEQMMERGEIEKVKSQHYKYPQTKYLPLREADFGALSARELETINEVLDRLSKMNGKQLDEYSQGDAPWISAEEGKPIDYERALYRTPPYSVRKNPR
jgi:transcriptional regulator with XRE-family HTH domain